MHTSTTRWRTIEAELARPSAGLLTDGHQQRKRAAVLGLLEQVVGALVQLLGGVAMSEREGLGTGLWLKCLG